MLILVYLVVVCSNFLFIKSEDIDYINVDVKKGENCTTKTNSYTLTEGHNVTLIVTAPHLYINHGWAYRISPTNTQELFYNVSRLGQQQQYGQGQYGQGQSGDTTYARIVKTAVVDKSMEGIWEFKFLYQTMTDGVIPTEHSPLVAYNDKNYTQAMCRTNVKIVSPKPAASSNDSNNTTLIIACVVGTILVAIIIAQTAYIIILKNQAQKLITLNTHNNLSKKAEPVPNDTARYCSNPGQKMMKIPTPMDDDNRDSVIYEAPNIELSSSARMPMHPPEPPALTTMPRTPRPEHNIKIGPQAMLASALNSPARSPMSDSLPPNFQKPKQFEREVSVANRPRLPLPHPGHPHNNVMFQEVYEDMDTEDNTYEPPPIINTMPPRLPTPPKKVPTGNLLDVKENTLKLRQVNKPPVTQKPQRPRSTTMTPANEFEQALRRRNNDTMTKPKPGHIQSKQPDTSFRRRPNVADTQTNELEEALRRRNNVMQVPITSIPDPSSRGPPKPKPPPALKKKPRGQPVPQPMQEEIYYNENQASSDEEWTYEPLKPYNSYDTNIYNV